MTRTLFFAALLALLGLLLLSACGSAGRDVSGHGNVRTVPATATVPTSSTTSSTSTTTTTAPVTTTRRTTTTARQRSAPITAAPVVAGRSLGRFTATCYGAFEGYGGHTASGEQSGPGSVATDPSVIPMGTRLQIEGYGSGHANDVGGAIRGHRIDVWFATAAECRAWGTRSVEVWAA